VKYKHSTFIKAATAVALLLALCGPTMPVTRHLPMGVVVVVDASAAMTPAQAVYATSVTNSIAGDKRTKWIRVVYAGDSRLQSVNNIERAVRDAAAMVPDGYSPRVVLISDGNTVRGDLSRAILELQQMHVAVDTTPLPVERIALESVALLDRVYSGERFAIDVAVISPHEAMAEVEINVGSGKWQAQSLHLQRGRNLIHTQQRALSPGAVVISGKVSAGGLGQVSFARLLDVRRANIAYVSHGSSGLTKHLLRALRTRGAAIAQKTSLNRDSLAGVQLIVLSNQDLTALNPAQKEQVAEYVTDGGGLLLLGGAEHPYKEDGRMDALDRVLPAAPAPPDNSGDKCVVILIDKSSSMNGEKIRMARQSVLAIADTLSPQDAVGVLAFDHTFRWVVPIEKFRDRRVFLKEVSNLTADGGTEIPPALSAAYQAVLMSKAKYRHLVLVTDGISEEGESLQLAREASRQSIAISTVGLGTAVNRSFLEAVASASGGRSYFLATAEDLKKITLKDVRDYTGSNAIDRAFKPIVLQGSGVLDGVDMPKASALIRYTRYTTKPGGEAILGIGEAGKDPLYVQWQYGLGRVGLFTSDALGEWATSWSEPSGFDQLWTNLARDLYSHTKTSEVAAVAGHEELKVRYSLGPKARRGAAPPKISVLGPNGFSKSVSLQETTPYSYAAQVNIGDQLGVFRVLPEPPSTEFPPTALLAQRGGEPGSGKEVLQEIARQTGGSFYTDPAFRPVGEASPVRRRIDLWPGLVTLAIVLNIFELALRRKRLSLSAFVRPRQRRTFSTVEN
jgi:Ca-activated chloride channel homolog